MKEMLHVLRRFVAEQDGQDIIEYGLLAAFISIVVYAFLSATGLHVKTMYSAIDVSTGAAASASSS